MKTTIKTLLVTALFALAASATAATPAPTAKGSVELNITGQMEQSYKDEKGETRSRLVPITKIVPGDEVVYTINYRNSGTVATDKVVITDPIPEHMAYKDGSAFGAGAELEFSADGGRTWGKPESLSVKGADGKPRAAVATDYTHVRWKLAAPVAAGQSGFVRYRADLR